MNKIIMRLKTVYRLVDGNGIMVSGRAVKGMERV
jgi:hypothetical protein